MSKKKYRITTGNKQFETDNDGPDYLKENNGVFYAKENTSDDWQQVVNFETKCNLFGKIFSYSIYALGFVLIYRINNIEDRVNLWFVWGVYGLLLVALLQDFLDNFFSSFNKTSASPLLPVA